MNCKKLWFTIFLFFAPKTVVVASAHDVIIRPARMQDLQEILALDYRVTFEYFKPVFIKSYAQLIPSEKIDDFLNQDLVYDSQIFPEIIKTQENARLHIAYDTNKKFIAGFLRFHKQEDVVELDFFVIDKDYRRMGIGRKLIHDAIATFGSVKTVVLYTLKLGNDNTHRFYESMGFKNMGPGSSDKKYSWGISYADLFFLYRLDISH